MIHLPIAYIGPGAGFAFLGSFLTLLLSLAASLLSLLLWPFRMVWRTLHRSRGMQVAGATKKVIFLGLDGLDAEFTEKLMAEGKLPNFTRLKEQGSYRRLRTTLPALSPIAWLTFATGVNPAKYTAHKSEPFWKILGRSAVESTILRVPVTFPQEEFNGRLLSAMATPGLPGTQGGFSYFTKRAPDVSFEGGNRYPLIEADGVLAGELRGPEDSILFWIRDPEGDPVLDIQGGSYALKPRQYTPWVRLKFGASHGGVHGIVRFLATNFGDEFSLYATEVQVDPESPAVPISRPPYYAIYLAKLLGSFSTLGMAEDTGALNDGVIDEDDFLAQTKLIQDEREAMFFSALDHQQTGVVACVFDTSDRVQHMFYRYLDPKHAATPHSCVIERMYCDMDRLVGQTLEHAARNGGGNTAVFVLSTHGFNKAGIGDHCVDPALVPGVLFSNRKLDAEDPGIEDMAPTVLRLFGIQPPEWMEGKSVISGADWQSAADC